MGPPLMWLSITSVWRAKCTPGSR